MFFPTPTSAIFVFSFGSDIAGPWHFSNNYTELSLVIWLLIKHIRCFLKSIDEWNLAKKSFIYLFIRHKLSGGLTSSSPVEYEAVLSGGLTSSSPVEYEAVEGSVDHGNTTATSSAARALQLIDTVFCTGPTPETARSVFSFGSTVPGPFHFPNASTDP
jgi:hypothetical protein